MYPVQLANSLFLLSFYLGSAVLVFSAFRFDFIYFYALYNHLSKHTCSCCCFFVISFYVAYFVLQLAQRAKHNTTDIIRIASEHWIQLKAFCFCDLHNFICFHWNYWFFFLLCTAHLSLTLLLSFPTPSSNFEWIFFLKHNNQQPTTEQQTCTFLSCSMISSIISAIFYNC